MMRSGDNKGGRMPLYSVGAYVDYATYESHTTYGKIGVKVWVYNGMNYGHEKNEDAGQLVRKSHRDRSQGSDEKSRTRRPARAADSSKE